MAFKPLLDEWRDSRQTRTDMPVGERCASIEHDLGGDMTIGQAVWELVFGPDDPDPDLEPG